MTDTSAAALAPALAGAGIQIEMGPFLVRLRSQFSSVADHVARFYHDFPIRLVPEGHFDVAVVGGRGIHRWIRRQAALIMDGDEPYLPLPEDLAGPSVEWGLNWCIGRRSHRWVAVHAAVVERGGRALILPAPSGSGKSTLCAALTYSGWRLLSDEFAILDPDTGLLLPLPRPLALKERSIDVIRARYPGAVYGPEVRDIEKRRFVHARPPDDAVRRVAERARPAWIVTPRYAAGERTVIEREPKSRMLMQVLDQSFNYNYLGALGFTTLVDLVRGVECYRLVYSDLDDVLARLGQLAAA